MFSDKELASRVSEVLTELGIWQSKNRPTSVESVAYRWERWIELVVDIIEMDTEQARLLSDITRVPLDDLHLGHDIHTYHFKYGSIEPVLKIISRILVYSGSRDPALRLLRVNLADKFRLHTRSEPDTYDPGKSPG